MFLQAHHVVEDFAHSSREDTSTRRSEKDCWLEGKTEEVDWSVDLRHLGLSKRFGPWGIFVSVEMVGLAKKGGGGLNWLYKTFQKLKNPFCWIKLTTKSENKCCKTIHFQLIKIKNNRLIRSYTMIQHIKIWNQ